MRIVRDMPVIPLVLTAVVLFGLVFAYMPSPYSYDIEFEVTDEEVQYAYESNIDVETTTVLLTNTGEYRFKTILALVDETYAALNPWDLQIEMFDDLGKYMSKLSDIEFITGDTKVVADMMGTSEPSDVAVMIASGAIPAPLYDGAGDVPLLDWLGSGGTVINIAGCLGKYVSTGPSNEDIYEVEGFGTLFAGVDDSMFMDSKTILYKGVGCNESVRDALHIQLNEYTFGVNILEMTDALSLTYHSEDGFSSVVAYRSGEGMVMNFGFTLRDHQYTDWQVAQILSSGMDYGSEILEWRTGDTTSTGTFSHTGPFSVYGYIGTSTAIYAERHDS